MLIPVLVLISFYVLAGQGLPDNMRTYHVVYTSHVHTLVCPYSNDVHAISETTTATKWIDTSIAYKKLSYR